MSSSWGTVRVDTRPDPRRVRALYRLSRPRLAAIIRERGQIVAAYPLESWSADELVTAVLNGDKS